MSVVGIIHLVAAQGRHNALLGALDFQIGLSWETQVDSTLYTSNQLKKKEKEREPQKNQKKKRQLMHW